ncbi:MAG: HNH endonuclease [Burkholderiales bacterium]|nr:HNH endonuclease [Burkholderiales bacterium]
MKRAIKSVNSFDSYLADIESKGRKPISKKVRFNIFKRDGFKCQYCGSTPPSVVLEVDHINPVSNGGNNDPINLITACFDCNRGKSNGLLNSIPESVVDKSELITEKLEQVKAYERLIKSKKRYEEKQIDEVQNTFNMYFEGYSFNKKFRESVRLFVQKLPIDSVTNAMQVACYKFQSSNDPNRATRYFCGICWREIRDSKGGY